MFRNEQQHCWSTYDLNLLLLQRKQFVISFVKRTVTLQENNKQLLQKIWRDKDIKIVNNKIVMKLFFRNLSSYLLK